MKVNYKRFIFLKILILIIALSKCEQASTQYNLKYLDETKNLVVINKEEQPYIIPHTVKRLEDSIVDRRIGMPNNQMMQTSPMMSSPMMKQRVTTSTGYLQQQIRPPACPCAAEVRCRPCNGIIEPPMEPYATAVTCPCAPPISCPKCPPVSLIHEIASKKV
jgi:hypothetical protein